MPYVIRDDQGVIVGIYQNHQEGLVEELPMNHPDIMAFLTTQDGTAAALLDLAESDMAMARVVEDVIELLILKGAIDFKDLPAPAQEKLSSRQKWRGSLEEALESFGGGKVI
ncbi:hypothetical protein [Terasakiella sp. SH-1]|uniref:hypothetical protein n=1 Tax=Terasakiella sp. SH-1 TaxID=2560057 RepID=UPI00107461A3|nr:hypothetical protein [Terasakiella sp. SH-1]